MVVAYAPGSFSKNFAWGDSGLRKFYDAIRSGFENNFAPVSRDAWRAKAGIDSPALELIPLNFFLYNLPGEQLAIDELVFQALKRPYSINFDRLALFAFHLSRVGSPPRKGPSRPALWANEFVRDSLWQGGGWRRSALTLTTMDTVIAPRIDGTSAPKIRMNYRRFFELTGYLTGTGPTINTGAADWAGSALFLTWDRFIRDGGARTEQALLSFIESEEIYKLLGASEAWTSALAGPLVTQYVAAGGPSRFIRGTIVLPPPGTTPGTGSPAKKKPSSDDEDKAALLDQEGSDEAVERRVATVLTQKRDRTKAARLKIHYGNACQFCKTAIPVADGRFYSEAAHIRPLGKPHDGPDRLDNMLVLCPNHHVQFDRGMIRLEIVGEKIRIASKVDGDPIDQKMFRPRHTINASHVEWHFDWHREERILDGADA